jgi:xanthine dehydrogenase YagT iron-sulfur-binding subunit
MERLSLAGCLRDRPGSVGCCYLRSTHDAGAARGCIAMNTAPHAEIGESSAKAQEGEPGAWTRREFVQGAAVIGGALVPSFAGGQANAAEPPGDAEMLPLSLKINREQHALTIEPRVTLLDLLRDRLGLTGTKKGCNHGQCGACTVLLNGRRVNSCLILAAMVDGETVTTIEGLAEAGALDPIQSAFIRHDAFQCGFCTPGQICSAVAMLEEHDSGAPSALAVNVSMVPPELSDNEIRERMSGNICRCGAYAGIVAAIRDVAEAREADRSSSR